MVSIPRRTESKFPFRPDSKQRWRERTINNNIMTLTTLAEPQFFLTYSYFPIPWLVIWCSRDIHEKAQHDLKILIHFYSRCGYTLIVTHKLAGCLPWKRVGESSPASLKSIKSEIQGENTISYAFRSLVDWTSGLSLLPGWEVKVKKTLQKRSIEIEVWAHLLLDRKRNN